MFKRLLVVASILLSGLAAAAPSTAAPAGTLSGKAGGYAVVTFPDQTRLTYKDFGALKADRGDFVGVALIDTTGKQWATYVQGRSTTCVFLASCQRYDFADFEGSNHDYANYDVVLAAGTYRVVLLGRPGATVSVTSTALRGTIRTTRAGTMRAASVASTLPATDQLQPEAGGAAAFAAPGMSVLGVVMRLDTALIKEAEYTFCLTAARPQLLGLGCSGPSRAGYIGYYECPGTPVCIPLGVTDSTVSTSEATVVNGSNPRASYDVEVRAGKSRVNATAFSFSF